MTLHNTVPKLQKQLFYIFTSWIMAAALEYYLLPKEVRALSVLPGISQMSGLRMFCITALGIAVWNFAARYLPKGNTERWLLVDVFVLYATSALFNSFTWPFFAVCCLVMLILAVYAVYGWDASIPVPPATQKESKPWPFLTAAAALVFFSLLSIWGIDRIHSFSTPTYDFGLFAQMFHSMKTTGLPITTLERDRVLSHFAVHVSPIYYLMLPVYCLFPHLETLPILQAAVLASAVIPLWKLGKRHGLHPGLRTAVCVLLLLYPAYSGGTSYDFHENCFLPPLILWLMYGIDQKNILLTALSAILTLMVKEDAPVYVAIIALYVLLRSFLHKDRWEQAAGGTLMLGAIAWFVAATTYLAFCGDGVMNYRYENFMYDGSNSLLTVIKAVLLCPMKAVFECVDAQKLKFIGITMLPLLGLPLITRRYERYLLLIPYLLINLMSDYPYQHDIMYQYTFGSTACLFYLVVVNLADLKPVRKQAVILGITLSLSLGCFHETILPKVKEYHNYCSEFHDYYQDQKTLLDTIPDDVSVAATTYYTTYLSNRSQIYDIHYSTRENILSCQYIVIKVTDSGSFRNFELDGEDGKENFVAMLLENGYELESCVEGVTEIYRKIG